jgi:hypothetical protein
MTREEAGGDGAPRVQRASVKERLYIGWVYVKSFFYALKSRLRRRPGTDPFIYR